MSHERLLRLQERVKAAKLAAKKAPPKGQRSMMVHPFHMRYCYNLRHVDEGSGRNNNTHIHTNNIMHTLLQTLPLSPLTLTPECYSTWQTFVKMTPAKDEGAAAAADGTPAAGTADGACTNTAGLSTTLPALPYHKYFSPPPAERCAASLTAVTEDLDAALAAAENAPPAKAMDWANQLRFRWKGLRPQQPRIYGEAPTILCLLWG